MRIRQNFWAGMAAGGLILFAAACNETRDTGAVTTETSSGSNTAPNAEGVEERDNALVRVVNAIPGGSASVYADTMLAFGNLAYKGVSEWKEMPDDYYGFRVTSSGATVRGDSLAENREKLSNGGHYTIIALPDEDPSDSEADEYGELRVLDDELKPLTDGKARVRFINAIAGLDDEISVYPAGSDNALVDGVNYKMEAGWNEEDPWQGTLEVRTEDRSAPLATIENVNLEAGKSYTFVFAGRANAVEVIKVVDEVHEDPDTDDGMPDDRTEEQH